MPNQNPSAHAARFHSGMLAIIGRRNSAAAENHVTEKSLGAFDVGAPQGLIFYSSKYRLDPATFKSFGTPGDLGGKVLSGDPQLSGRVDFLKGPETAGLFMATTGKVEITFPFNEHATILHGELTLTDTATGETRSLKAGDSYFVKQGQVVIWDVKDKYVIKSFYNVVSPAL
jgi:hypothetical protein